jgi:hypothetical protein
VTDLRAIALTPGTCSFCGRPAERGLSGAWWHTGTSCNQSYGVMPAGSVPAGPLGWRASWPPRFIPETR